MSWTKCKTATCNDLATVRVFWPGQTSDMCAQCALRAKGVAAAMGFPLSVAIIVPPDRESGDSIPAAAPAGFPFPAELPPADVGEPPVLNKSGGSDVEGK